MNTSTALPELLLTLISISTVAVVLVRIGTSFLRRKSAALRHFLWLLALSAPLVAPPLAWMHARIVIPLLPPVVEQLSSHDSILENQTAFQPSAPVGTDRISAVSIHSQVSAPQAQSNKFVLPFNPWFGIWLFGATLIIVRIVVSQARVKRSVNEECSPGLANLILRLNKARHFFGFFPPVHIMTTPLTEIPFCYGIFHPTMIFPQSWHEWEDERIDICLTHELAHIIRGDLLAMLTGQVACILCWFNPLVWFAASKLRDEAENVADDLVLARNIRPETYAANLVAITEKYRASALSPTIALSMARPNRLKSRVEAILDSTLLRKAPRLATIVAVSALVFVPLITVMVVR